MRGGEALADGALAVARRLLLRPAARLRLCRRARRSGTAGSRVPIALLSFNLGVEIGQLVFVAAVMTAGDLFRRAMAPRLEPAMLQQTLNRLDVTAAYAIGAIAACWLIERTTAFIA